MVKDHNDAIFVVKCQEVGKVFDHYCLLFWSTVWKVYVTVTTWEIERLV